jgi:hypothetical protein
MIFVYHYSHLAAWYIWVPVCGHLTAVLQVHGREKVESHWFTCQSYFTTRGLPTVSSSWRQTPWDVWLAFFQLNTCGYIPCLTSSLTRRWMCCLQLLLVLASAVNPGSKSRGAHILLSQIQDSTNLEGQIAVFISHRNRMAQLYPRHRVPCSSPPTTRRATVEVFESSSMREWFAMYCEFPFYTELAERFGFLYTLSLPITVTARSEAWTVFARSDASRSQWPRGLRH